MIVKIKNLRCKVYLGIFEWERKRKRNIFLNISYNISDSSKTQKEILDYDMLSKKITKFLGNRSFELIENLSFELADFLAKEKNILWVEVECCKPHALTNAKTVCVLCKKDARI